MDRSQFLLIGCMTAVMSAVQLGCGRDSSGEYRTVSADQLDERALEETSSPNEKARQELKPGDSDVPTESYVNDASTIPIEPELTPDTESDGAEGGATDAGAADEVLLAAAAAGPTGLVNDVEVANESQLSPDIDPSNAIASRGDVPLGSADGGAEAVTDLAPVPAEARKVELLVPEKSFKTEGPEQAIRVSYDDLDLLKVLNMEPVPEDARSHFPEWLNGLDAGRLRIRGFMYPTFESTNLGGFVLARDNQICCFGRNPKIYDLIEVAMRDGVTTDYIQGRPFDVVGVLHIRPEWDADEGKLVRLYQIDDALVIDR